MAGFFSATTLSTQRRIALCGSCGLNKTCLSPKMPPSGEGRKKVLVIAEAPGKIEDAKNTQLVGESGMLLRKFLKEIGISLDRDCWKTNAVCCRPPKNATPTLSQINACSPNVFNAIKQYDPNVIILLGGVSVQSVIGTLRKETITNRSAWYGWRIPCQELNAWICPTYHPSYLLRTQDSLAERFFKDHLIKAFELADSKPWKEVPDYSKEIEVIFDPQQAASILKEFHTFEGLIAFDYETNALKPEYKKAKIVSASVCFEGKRTIAFPFTEITKEALIPILVNPKIGKIGSNIKFEHRWTKKIIGVEVRRWVWDTMIAAHVLDNRPGITGLKFQSFVLLGQPLYNQHVESYLNSDSEGINKIHLINISELLKYNALDALLEYKVAKIQMKQLKEKASG